MTEPSLVEQTITISHNVAIVAASCFGFAGFMVGYAIAWWQRGRHDAHSLAAVMRPPGGCYFLGGLIDLDQLAALRENAEDRVRRSQE